VTTNNNSLGNCHNCRSCLQQPSAENKVGCWTTCRWATCLCNQSSSLGL